MTNRALRDQNDTPTKIAVSSSDGTTIDALKADATRHNLKISDGTTGTTPTTGLPVSLIGTYPISNYNGFYTPIYSGVNTGAAQMFTNQNSVVLDYCQFYLVSNGSPTGTAQASLYAITGNYGTTAVPTGTAVATSATVDVSTVPVGPTLITFTFTGANAITLSPNTQYAIAVSYSGGDSSNNIAVGEFFNNGDSIVNAGGNAALFFGSWSATLLVNFCFLVYGFIVSFNAKIDENGVASMLAVSLGDGKTPIPLYTDGNGNLLIQST